MSNQCSLRSATHWSQEHPEENSGAGEQVQRGALEGVRDLGDPALDDEPGPQGQVGEDGQDPPVALQERHHCFPHLVRGMIFSADRPTM